MLLANLDANTIEKPDMTSRYKLKGYAETRDALTWVMLSAPKLKYGLTMDEVLSALEGGFDSVKCELKDEARLGQLEESRSLMREAFAFFKQERSNLGTQKMQQASELFTRLRRVNGQAPTRQQLGDSEHGANEVNE